MELVNKEISSYLIWIAVNLLVLLSLGTFELGSETFYPLDGFDKISDYDISEFLAYTVTPLLVIIAVKLRKK